MADNSFLFPAPPPEKTKWWEEILLRAPAILGGFAAGMRGQPTPDVYLQPLRERAQRQQQAKQRQTLLSSMAPLLAANPQLQALAPLLAQDERFFAPFMQQAMQAAQERPLSEIPGGELYAGFEKPVTDPMQDVSLTPEEMDTAQAKYKTYQQTMQQRVDPRVANPVIAKQREALREREAAQQALQTLIPALPALPEPAAPTPQVPQAAAPVAETSAYVPQEILQQAPAYGVDPTLVRGVLSTERSGVKQTSPDDARGRFQLLPKTALDYAVTTDPATGAVTGVRRETAPTLPRVTAAQLLDDKINTAVGLAHLKHLSEVFPGRADLVFAAWHAGEQATRDAGGAIPNTHDRNMTTAHYVMQALQAARGESPTALSPAAPPAAAPTTTTAIATLRQQLAVAQQNAAKVAAAAVKYPQSPSIKAMEQHWRQTVTQLHSDLRAAEAQAHSDAQAARRDQALIDRQEAAAARRAQARPGEIAAETTARQQADYTSRLEVLKQASTLVDAGDIRGAERLLAAQKIPRNEWDSSLSEKIETAKAAKKRLRGNERWFVDPKTFRIQAADTKGEADAAQLVEIPTEARKEIYAGNALRTYVGQIHELLDKITAPGGALAGFQAGDQRTAQAWQKRLADARQTDPDIKALDELLADWANKSNMAIGGFKGRPAAVLIEQAMKKAPTLQSSVIGSVPGVGPYLGQLADSPDTIRRQVQRVDELVVDLMNTLLYGSEGIEMRRQGQQRGGASLTPPPPVAPQPPAGMSPEEFQRRRQQLLEQFHLRQQAGQP